MIKNKKKWFKNLGLTTTLALVLLFWPSGHASAGPISWFMGTVAEVAFDVLVTNLLGVVFFIIQEVIVFFLGVFNYLVYIRVDNGLPVVEQTWRILRDFCNMLFIIALIWMAFATMFDSGKMKFQENIWKLVLVAVLINFSLVIGGLVIDASQVMTNVFLNTIGDPGARLGQYLNPAEFFDSDKPQGVSIFSGGISLVFYVIISSMFLFGIMTATVFALFRIFAIWGLLIVSPLAWMAYVFPGTRPWFKKWWGEFLGWNLYLPVYLFFLYLGFVFLSQRESIIQAVASNAGDPNSPIGGSNLSFNLTFFYIFAAVILGGGAALAKSVTSSMSMGGKGFEKWAGRANDWVKRVPGFNQHFAAQKAAGMRAEQFQKEGFKNPYLNKVYGGEAAQKRLETTWQQRFGVAGSGKTFVKDASQAFERIEDEYDTGKLNVEQLRQKVASTSATSAEGFAYRKLAIKKGALDDEHFASALASVAKNPFMVQDLIKTAKDAKFAGIKDLKKIAMNKNLTIPARREMLLHMASDPRLASRFKAEDLSEVTGTLGGASSPEAKKFIDDLSKVRPDLAYDYKKNDAGEIVNPDGSITTKDQFWAKAVRTEAKNLIDMPKDVWNTDEFKTALEGRFNDLQGKAKRGLKQNLQRMLMEKGELRGGGGKLDVLEYVTRNLPADTDNEGRGAGRRGRGDGSRGNPPANPSPIIDPTTGRPFGGTVSYRTPLDMNENNVIDLRKNRNSDIDIEET